MSKRIILGVEVTNRVERASDVQKVLTEFGCVIKTRLGLHEVSETSCSPSGLLILETYGDESSIQELEKKLAAIPGVNVQKMVFGE
ncbi:MAG: hypothetical protein N3B12_03315 [Armatimonadetes bacterium]|nr:hypothetical protein [Armatimonadota bacterium]